MGTQVLLCCGERQVILFKLKELKSKLAAQQQLKAKPRSLSNNATISSFKISNVIVKKCRPFTEGECVKEFLEIAYNFF
jgi:hypothetical protein